MSKHPTDCVTLDEDGETVGIVDQMTQRIENMTLLALEIQTEESNRMTESTKIWKDIGYQMVAAVELRRKDKLKSYFNYTDRDGGASKDVVDPLRFLKHHFFSNHYFYDQSYIDFKQVDPFVFFLQLGKQPFVFLTNS